ncbi:MAG: c-type cytochrome [Nitrospira sp.]|nr:cytochrome c [Candidatus Manganitrophaceae bacterium]HIL35279.1 cytochrome c [Candidatus Manganitrophaceae bacterium]
MFNNKKKTVLTQVLMMLLVLPVVAWAGGGATGFIDAGTFALVIEAGLVLGAIFLGWIAKDKMGIKIPKLIQGPILWIMAYVNFRVILQPPIPFSLLAMYMGVCTLVILLYCSLTVESWEDFSRPIASMLRDDHTKAKMSRYATFLILPGLIAAQTYNTMLPSFGEPIELRTVHPAPPASINVHKKLVTLQTAENPFRIGDDGEYLKVGDESKYFGGNSWTGDVPRFLQEVRDGGVVFFGTAGCFFCHGDNLDGRGPFAFAFNPIPANFADPGTIAQLQETFVFWRVAKGGPDLSREAFPWASAMPPWEKHLTTNEIWKVIVFEYWHTGFFPRTWG